MKGSYLNTTSTFLAVAFGMMTFLFFGVNAFLGISSSANTVAENIDHLNAVDLVHLLTSCLEGGDGVIDYPDIQGSISSCPARFPGLSSARFEYMVEDLDLGGQVARSAGYDPNRAVPSHRNFILIRHSDGEIHGGRIHVQAG